MGKDKHQTGHLLLRPFRFLGRFLPSRVQAGEGPATAVPAAASGRSLVPAIFLHIRKTGGTSIVRQALDHYGYQNVCNHGDYMGKRPDDLRRLPFVSGHFGFDYARTLLPGRFSFTFLRDPIERIISLYCFCRLQDPDEFPIYRAAATRDLEGFLQAADHDGLVRAYIWNSQVWCLAAGPGYVETLEAVARPEALLTRALKNIERLSFVGLLETFDRDARLIMRALNMTADETIRKDNVTRDRIAVADLSSPTMDRLRELTQWDRRLYDAVRKRRLEGH